jgi:hypothetical protein
MDNETMMIAALMVALAIGVIAMIGFSVKKNAGFANLPLLKAGDEIAVEQNATGNDFGRPYTTRPIQSVDDYDHDVVYMNEGDRQWSKAQINQMTEAYPFAWPQLPPSATNFQKKQEEYMASLSSKLLPDLSQYKAIEGFQVLPPDTEKQEAEEQKLLKTYVPACSKDLKYDVDDAMDLIKKIYDQKGLVAKVDVRPDGIYEVYETQEKEPKIVYDDDTTAGPQAPVVGGGASSATFAVPQVASDLAAGLDPFFNAGAVTRSGRTDYTQWTPGLERMFAPTYPLTNWY